MKKIILIYISVFFVVFPGRAQTDPNHPNVLLIIADDLGLDYSNGFQDNALMPVTPHLDSLRESGIAFTKVWASPRCSPSRAAIMSGQYGVKTGVTASDELDTSFISVFREIEMAHPNTYADAVIGKWHIESGQPNYDHTSQHGIDYYDGFWNSGVEDYYNWTRVDNNGQTLTETTYVTEHLTNEAINWINNRTSPWFLWLAHGAPHGPFHTPPIGTYTQSPLNNNSQMYTAAIESMDYYIGEMLDQIPPAVKNNTVIIFIGDNGTPNGVLQNYPQGHGKSSLYQGGVGVPMIISGKDVTRINEKEDANLHVNDLFATILEITGTSLPGGKHNSFSFKSLLTNTNVSTPRYTYADFRTDWTIRNERYKLIYYLDCVKEFYDLENDSLETNNLINNLTTEQEQILFELEREGKIIRSRWSCEDQVQNGNELDVDCGGSCENCPGIQTYDCKEQSIAICEDIEIDSFVFAKDTISSSFMILTDQVAFNAEQSIDLLAGFDSGMNDFEALIETCLESGINDINCPNDNFTSQTNIGCCSSAFPNSSYTETVSGGVRMISTNDLPNHSYCANSNNTTARNYNFSMPEVPMTQCEKTSILRITNQPSYFFGVALNGVVLAPSPAEPFIFENTNTGEYNWNWVFEPTNVQGNGQNRVALDCSSGHAGNQGYHYHGNMFQYIEEVVQPGLSTQTTPPSTAVQIGWAADGFPILYRFGPDENGNLVLLQPSYELKYGNRPGDGVSAPCGSYNGRYTNDYRYVTCSGDLDECNGVERSITLQTNHGMETFSYFYVITDEFPQIPRCFSGAPDVSFQ